MNILYICPRLPYPPDQGDKVVIYNNLKHLSKRNKITLLTFLDDEKELKNSSNLLTYCTAVETFIKRSNFSIINFLLAAIWTVPFTIIRYYSPQMLRRSKELIESRQFDIVHVDFYYMAQYVLNKKIKVPKKTATIFTAHNVEYMIYSKYARLAKAPLAKLFIWLESLRIKMYEPTIFQKFDSCIAFSELDKTNIIKFSGASNIKVNPACMEVKEGQKESIVEEDSIAYLGRLNTLPNDDAIKFFYKNIFPLIKEEVPTVKFVIAGKSPSKYIFSLTKDPSVELVGYVPDISELLNRIKVVIVPLRMGGGIRIKILEAWSFRKAVVSTSIGTEGVNCKNNEDLFIADTPSDFKDAVVKLLKDNKLRQDMGEAGFRKVCDIYNPEKIIEGLETIYKKTVEGKSG